MAAKVAHPDRQVVLLVGDGAFGFSAMEFDTFARLGINVVAVMGNNGIWALEKHPMEFLYGYSVAAELRPGTRYDQVVEALGGHGELVERPGELKPALERAFAAGARRSSTSSPTPTSSIPADRTWRRADLADAALAARVLAVQRAGYADRGRADRLSRPAAAARERSPRCRPPGGAVAVRGGRRAGRRRRPRARRGRDGHRACSSWRRAASGAAWARRSSRTRWRRPRGAACACGTGARNAPALALYERFGFRRLDERLRRRRAAATSSSCASPEERWKPPEGGFQSWPRQDGQGYVP
jgi:hypothetical protein